MPSSDEKPARLTVSAVKVETDALLAIAAALEPFSRETQLRILEAVCTLGGDDQYARLFREARHDARVTDAMRKARPTR